MIPGGGRRSGTALVPGRHCPYPSFVPNLNKVRTAFSGGPGENSAAPSLLRLRATITVFFALDGFLFAGWVVRIPAIKSQTGASSSALGLALLGVSVGAVITMMLTGRLCRRFGNHVVTVVCGVLLSLSIALPPQTHSALTLGLVLLVFGAGYGGVNVAMNSAAVDLVAALRRPVMPSFHAAFSLGGMVGAGVGGLVAGRLSAATHLLGLTVVGLLVTGVAGRELLRHRAPAAENSTPRKPGTRRLDARSRRLVLVFGTIALCTSYGEGSMADWSALHLKQDLHTHPGVAAAAYSLFALAMTLGRLTGTALLERLGQTRVLVGGATLAAAGMLLGSLAPTTWLALVGFVMAGLGLANSFPVAMARAGALAGPGGVATASTLGYGGMLLGPPVIGFLADALTLPVALTTMALLAATAALIGYATRNASSATTSAPGTPSVDSAAPTT